MFLKNIFLSHFDWLSCYHGRLSVIFLHIHSLNPYSHSIKLKTKWGGIVAMYLTHINDVLGLILKLDIVCPD
jgi:hypothetical protein